LISRKKKKMPRSPKKSPAKKRVTKPKSKKANHPLYRDMITEAIWEDKKWTKGTSRQAIAKFIVANYNIEESVVRQKLRIALTKAKEDGILIQNKGCYKLSPEWKEDWKKKGVKTTTKPKRKSSKKGGKRRKKSTSRKRDKNAPKRGQSSYIIFARSIRDDVKRKHPDASFGDISKITGAKWAKVPESKRAKFEALAAEDKKRYEKEMKAYRKKKKLESSSSSSPSSSSSSSSSSEAPSSSSSEEGEKKKKRKSDKSSSSSEGEKKKKKSEKSSSSDEDKKKKEKEKEKTDKTEKSKIEEVKKT